MLDPDTAATAFLESAVWSVAIFVASLAMIRAILTPPAHSRHLDLGPAGPRAIRTGPSAKAPHRRIA